MVEQHNCGLFVSPEDPKDLAEKLLYLKSNPELVRSMGNNARKLAETTYDKSILCDKFVNQVDFILGG
jgi:glycosyltransferase involved in cell wall biosynthesis